MNIPNLTPEIKKLRQVGGELEIARNIRKSPYPFSFTNARVRRQPYAVAVLPGGHVYINGSLMFSVGGRRREVIILHFATR